MADESATALADIETRFDKIRQELLAKDAKTHRAIFINNVKDSVNYLKDLRKELYFSGDPRFQQRLDAYSRFLDMNMRQMPIVEQDLSLPKKFELIGRMYGIMIGTLLCPELILLNAEFGQNLTSLKSIYGELKSSGFIIKEKFVDAIIARHMRKTGYSEFPKANLARLLAIFA